MISIYKAEVFTFIIFEPLSCWVLNVKVYISFIMFLQISISFCCCFFFFILSFSWGGGAVPHTTGKMLGYGRWCKKLIFSVLKIRIIDWQAILSKLRSRGFTWNIFIFNEQWNTANKRLAAENLIWHITFFWLLIGDQPLFCKLHFWCWNAKGGRVHFQREGETISDGTMFSILLL